MRDLNHLYSELLVENTLRERRAQAQSWSDVAEATASQPHAWQRLLSAIRITRPKRPEPVGRVDMSESAVS